MAGKRRKKIREPEITGVKYFKKLLPLLERLHDDGCARDKAGNRSLHFDQYCTLILLYLFNPVVTSLRGLQQASELGKVQKKLGCPRTSLGSFSEAATVFDPERLKEIITELGEELTPLGRDPRLQDVQGLLTIVDGTLLSALPKMMEASLLKRKTGSGMVKWPRTCWMCLQRRSRCCMSIAGRSRSSSDSSSTSWAADICSATTSTASRFRRTAQSSPA